MSGAFSCSTGILPVGRTAILAVSENDSGRMPELPTGWKPVLHPMMNTVSRKAAKAQRNTGDSAFQIFATWRLCVRLIGLALSFLLSACDRSSTPLPQQVYVWQRDWTSAVSASVSRPSPKLEGLVVLGAQVSWKQSKAIVMRPDVDWKALSETHKAIGIGLRIDPFNGRPDEATTKLFADASRALIATAKEHGVECAEFQVDFDSPQKKLADYRDWLRSLRSAIKPTRCVITALPAWLDEPEFPKLLAEVDGYVLQVHSVTTRDEERVALCDPSRARRWVTKAGQLGFPFVVSLPTYSALVGYDESGKSLGMALDGVQPAWPHGTKVREFFSDPEELLALANGWKTQHPAAMKGLIWYRLPVDSDVRNWRWPTFAAVVEGRELKHQLEAVSTGENPVDFSLVNRGEVDEALTQSVIVSWEGAAPITSDALPGWTLMLEEHRAQFMPSSSPSLRLPPGGRRGIGWLRFDQRASLHVEISL